jgi:glycosyltransferase involved in cell wall biosynthesis
VYQTKFCYILYTIYSFPKGCSRLNAQPHIGIDVRKYRDFGIGTYIQNLLEQYSKKPCGPTTLLAAPNDARTLAARYASEGWTTAINASPKYSIQELFSLSRQARLNQLDVLHCPHYTLPVGLGCRSVVTIHDLIQIRFPEYFSLAQRAYARLMIGHACAHADRIIVDSAFTQQDIETEFPSSHGKIETIHLGVSEHFGVKRTDVENAQFLKKFGLTQPYILYVGSTKPHKNIGVLLEGYKQSDVFDDVRLVTAGESLALNAEAALYLNDSKVRSRITELGRIDDNELASAYQNAAAVVLPSRYEGFGFSIVEAMRAGVPVIGARAASIPEVMGGAGLLFDPDAPEELASLMTKVITDDTLHASLRAGGSERVKAFSWKSCAEKTMNAYHTVLQ